MGRRSENGSQEEPSNAYLLHRLAVATTRPDVASIPVAERRAGGTESSGIDSGEAAAAEPSLATGRRIRMVPISTFDVPGRALPIGPPDGWTDMLTGADGPQLWDRIILSEQARVARYHRPVTVCFAEIRGIELVAGRWGWDVACRALATCARRLAHEVRSSDQIARIEVARFGILLTETTEIAAINFIERARISCERELKTKGDDVTIGFGWASPPDGGDLSDAVGIALARLSADLGADAPG